MVSYPMQVLTQGVSYAGPGGSTARDVTIPESMRVSGHVLVVTSGAECRQIRYDGFLLVDSTETTHESLTSWVAFTYVGGVNIVTYEYPVLAGGDVVILDLGPPGEQAPPASLNKATALAAEDVLYDGGAVPFYEGTAAVWGGSLQDLGGLTLTEGAYPSFPTAIDHMDAYGEARGVSPDGVDVVDFLGYAVMPAGFAPTDSPLLHFLISGTAGEVVADEGSWFVQFRTFIAPLRYGQRNDGVRQRSARSTPSSKQASTRQGWRNTYL